MSSDATYIMQFLIIHIDTLWFRRRKVNSSQSIPTRPNKCMNGFPWPLNLVDLSHPITVMLIRRQILLIVHEGASKILLERRFYFFISEFMQKHSRLVWILPKYTEQGSISMSSKLQDLNLCPPQLSIGIWIFSSPCSSNGTIDVIVYIKSPMDCSGPRGGE